MQNNKREACVLRLLLLYNIVVMKRVSFAFLLLLSLSFSARSQYIASSLGQWRDHLSYYRTHAVFATGNSVLVAAESSLFYFNKYTKETERFSKVNGLSDAGVGVTGYDPQTKATVITYDNSNIDILQNGKVYNISDIKVRSIEGSKSINDIYFYNSKAYLACGFGIVVLDLDRKEIYDTYYVGKNNAKIAINNIVINDTAIFAGTVEGLLYAPKNSPALSASETWKKFQSIGNTGKADYNINFLLQPNKRQLLVGVAMENSTNSTVYLFDGKDWTTAFDDEYIANLRLCDTTLILTAYRSVNLYSVNDIAHKKEYFHMSDEWNPLHDVKLDINDITIDGEDLWLAHDYRVL